MDWGGAIGELELRRAARDGSRRLKGKFPYKKRAVLSDGGKNGKPQKEEFEPKAFAYRINKPDEDMAEMSFVTGEGKRAREMDAAFGIVTGAVQLLKKLADDIEALEVEKKPKKAFSYDLVL